MSIERRVAAISSVSPAEAIALGGIENILRYDRRRAWLRVRFGFIWLT